MEHKSISRCSSYKCKATLGNTGTVGEEVVNKIIKVKRGAEGKNLGQYLFRPTTPKKEIPHIFNLTMPKEDFMHSLHG